MEVDKYIYRFCEKLCLTSLENAATKDHWIAEWSYHWFYTPQLRSPSNYLSESDIIDYWPNNFNHYPVHP